MLFRSQPATPPPGSVLETGSTIDRLRAAIVGPGLLAALASSDASIDGDTLSVMVAPSQLSFVELERETLAGWALKAFGRKLRVLVRADQSAAAEPPRPKAAAAEPASRPKAAPPAASPVAAKTPNRAAAEAKSKAKADALVNRTLDMFGGSLLDVKPLDVVEEESAEEPAD